MKSFYVFPYRMGSKSAAALARALKVPQIRHKGSKFIGSQYKTVINWGASELSSQIGRCRILNKLTAVRRAGNKLEFFRSQSSSINNGKSPRLVPWTTSREEASKWLKEKYTVVARRSLTGHSGHGITIVEPGQDLPSVPLYTRYIPKDGEYRVHIINGEVVDTQRKIRDPDSEPKNWKVRSHDNGFIYVRQGFEVPKDVVDQAKLAFSCSGLEFGAFDIIWNRKRQEAYVLEINCAPGLSGHTIDVYANGFLKLISNRS